MHVHRRLFLKLVGGGIAIAVVSSQPGYAHHKPGHNNLGHNTTTTATTIVSLTSGAYSDIYSSTY